MFNFGQAVTDLKAGNKITRQGWNGKSMYLYLGVSALPYPPLSRERDWEEGAFEESTFIIMKTADNKLIPWLASQTDILAEDWVIVE